MSEEEKIALFDAYTRDEMSDSEKSDFEEQLAQSPEFKTEFEAYLSFSKEIKEGEEYGKITSTLREIHKDVSKPKKLFFIQAKFWIPLAAAAAVLIVFMAVPDMMGMGGETASENNANMAEEDMNYLGNDDADDVMSEEGADEGPDEEFETDSLEFNAESEDKSELNLALDYVAQLVPKGTCFPISNQGYFITAKHLVHKRRYVKLQQRDLDIAFNTEVIYRDSVLDFAILKCSDKNADLLERVPFRMVKNQPSLGDDVFTLGYPKADIVYTKGDVSSENGFRSDSMTYQISMPANPGNSGAPLFTRGGDLAGFIIANNSKKQSVTYVIKPEYISDRIAGLQESFEISMKSNYSSRIKQTSSMIKKYRPFIFEVH